MVYQKSSNLLEKSGFEICIFRSEMDKLQGKFKHRQFHSREKLRKSIIRLINLPQVPYKKQK